MILQTFITQKISAVKGLIASKSFCLHNICVCTVYIYTHLQHIFWKYLHAYTCIYLYSYILYYKIYLIYKHTFFLKYIHACVCIYIHIINIHSTLDSVALIMYFPINLENLMTSTLQIFIRCQKYLQITKRQRYKIAHLNSVIMKW